MLEETSLNYQVYTKIIDVWVALVARPDNIGVMLSHATESD